MPSLALGTPTAVNRLRTQQVPLDFAGRRLWEFLDDFNPPRIFEWSQTRSDVILNLGFNVAALIGVRQNDVRLRFD